MQFHSYESSIFSYTQNEFTKDLQTTTKCFKPIAKMLIQAYNIILGRETW